jgi:tRNA threonylcarbamoyladenosine biosynthesis protein TsaB
MDKIPASLEKYLILFSSDLEFILENKIIMKKLIINVANEKIFLVIITTNDIYSITHENTKINYEKLTIIIKDFLNTRNLEIGDINKIYVNRGPGSFAGIRNSLSVVKAFYIAKKIDYYCYSFEDFKGENDIRYEDIPSLCDKFKIKKNFIKPIYVS